MATYTPKELVPPTQLANAAASVYTQPGGGVVSVVRTIHAQCPAAGHAFTLSRGADAAATRLFDAYALTQKVPAIFNGWWVIAAGLGANALQAFADAAAQVVLQVSGYEFS
jgi:hypothetical protein